MNNLLRNVLHQGARDLIGVSDIVPSLYDNLDFNAFSQHIDRLMNTQHKLNTELCGDGYDKTLVTSNGKLIRFGNALISESNELLDSTSWKHWKKIDAVCDTENIATELIDYLHFLPSIIAIMLRYLRPDTVLEHSVNFSEDYQIIKIIAWNTLNTENYSHDDDTTKITISLLSLNSILGGLCNLSAIFNKDIVSVTTVMDDMFLDRIKHLVGMSLGLTFKNYFIIYQEPIEDMMSKYIVKNILNSFRADNGYKEGTYIKIWKGTDVEDNVVAKTILKLNPMFSNSELYTALEVEYQLVLQGIDSEK